MRLWGKQVIKNAQAKTIKQIQIFGDESHVLPVRFLDALRRSVQDRLGRDLDRYKLKHPRAIPIPWSRVDRPARSSLSGRSAERLPREGDVTRVPDLLRQLPPRERRLAVLGAPGSGKSILARIIAWGLLREWRPGEPVPIVLALSSWRPPVSLLDWVAKQAISMCRDPFIKRKIKKEDVVDLINDRLIMPILDALDELPAVLHEQAIEAVEALIAREVPLVITCRKSDYESARKIGGGFLVDVEMIELDSVSADDAIAYLSESTADIERWSDVFATLRSDPDSPLSRVFSSPLMLYLAHVVYRRPVSRPAELLKFRRPEHIESHLIAAYIPAVYSDPSSRYNPKKAKRYLAAIADQMKRDKTSNFGWWQLNSTFVDLGSGALIGVAWGWLISVLLNPWIGSAIGGVSGYVGAKIYQSIRRNLGHVYITEDSPDRWPSSIRRYFIFGFVSSVASALSAAAFLCGLLLALGVDTSAIWRYALFFGLVSGAVTMMASAWGLYRLSHFVFVLTGQLPVNLVKFMEHSCELGVLREAGPAYQFRHVRLQYQLSGPLPTISRSAFTAKNSSDSRDNLFAPLIPSIVHFVMSIVGVLFGWLMLLVIERVQPAAIVGGDRPRVSTYPQACRFSAPCVYPYNWTWELPERSSRRALLTKSDEYMHVFWKGSLTARGCDGAAAEIIMTLGDGAPVRFILKSGSRLNVGNYSTSTRIGRGHPAIDMRRIDTKKCELSVIWSDGGYVIDYIATLRARLGSSAPG